MTPPESERPTIPVVWDRRQRRPVSFFWRHRRYRVERVLRTWVIQTGWWDERLRTDRRYFRVRADGRLFDLCFDRRARRWSLERSLG